MSKLAGDHVQVLVGGYALTGDSNRININDSRMLYDVTAFGDGVHQYIPGQRMMAVQHAGYLNNDSARSHPVLSGNAVDGVFSVLVGQNTDPAEGDPMFSLGTQQTRYGTLPQVNKFVPFNAAFANRGDLGGWGVALAVPTDFTTSSNGGAVDNGVASSNGGMVCLHLLSAAASDTYTITVEGSATGAFSGEESTLATFNLDASAIGSEHQLISGAIPQYTRWKAVRAGSAGDTVSLAISLIRY